MESNPAPSITNSFLCYCDRKQHLETKTWYLRKARIFSNIYRFLDDLWTFNNNEFENIYKDDYFDVWELGKEIEDPCKALFLNLSIEVHDRKFFGKLFNKRDAFPYFINRMPYLDSDIPSEIFYALIGSHILCIAKTAT